MDEDEPSFYASEKFLIYYLLRYLQQYSEYFEDFDNYLQFVFIKYSHCIYMLELLKNRDINKLDISKYIGDIDISKYFSKSLKPHDELYAYFRLLRALTYIIEDIEMMSTIVQEIIVQEIIDVLGQIQLEKTINNEFDLLNERFNRQVLKEFDFIIKSIYAYDSEPIVPMPTGIEVARVAGGRINNNNMTNKLKVKKQANKKRHYKSKKQKNRRKSTLKEKKQRKYKSRKNKRLKNIHEEI